MIETTAPYKDIADQVVEVFGTQVAVAKALGYSDIRNVSAWTNGHRQFPQQHCVTLEQRSDAKLVCEALRPDLRWVRVKDKSWPHKEGRPLLDVSAPVTTTEA